MSPAEVLDEAIRRAFEVRERAHAPYSGFRVGAVLVLADGSMHAGCNFEVASYGGTVCAERNAIGAMVAAGGSRPVVCVVATHDVRPTMPCGICRQSLVEVSDDTLRIVSVAEVGREGRKSHETTLGALLPLSFRFDPATKAQPA